MIRHAGRVWMLLTACAALAACDETRGDDVGASEPADSGADASQAVDAAADAALAGDAAQDAATGATDASGPARPADAGDASASLDDAGSNDAGDVDSGPARVIVAGRVLDAWTHAGVDSALVTAEGSDPLVSDTANASGEYALELLEGDALTPLVTRAGHRPTRNPESIADESTSHDVHLVAAADASRQYTGLGLTPVAGSAIVLATLRDADGNALEGIPLADIALVDGTGIPVGLGPYFFGAAGDLVDAATLAVSTAYDGRTRVGFLDCPPGEHELEVSVTGGSLLAQVTCSAGGATLVVPAQ